MAHFHTTRRVEFCDTDLAGIVHFANYYRYMEQAEHAFFRALGLKITGVLADGTHYGWPRVSASCSFKSPARYDELLEIQITIVRHSQRSLTASYEFFREGTHLASGEMKTVFCVVRPNEPLQSVDMPAEILGKLQSALAASEPLWG